MQRAPLFTAAIALVLVAAPAHATGPIVISQVMFRGAGGTNDEAIELFNVTSAPIDLNGWRLVGSNTNATSVTTRLTFGVVTIMPNGFLLVANSAGSLATGADATYATGINDTGGVELVDAAGNVSDAVCSSSCLATFCEANGLTFPTADGATNAFLRKGSECTRQDTDDNTADFTGPAAPAFKDSDAICGACGGHECITPPGACYAAVGTCAGGDCTYAITSGASCSDNDACTTGTTCNASAVCGGGTTVTCTTPPSPICSNANTRVTYASSGTCNPSDGCHYTPTSTTCPLGCAAGACVTDPCAGGTCNSPPNSTCYAPTGTCNAGVCSYTVTEGVACDDNYSCTENDTCDSAGSCSGTIKQCKTPPASYCEDANLRIYTNGSCAAETGECIYAATLTYCVDGCDRATATCIGGIVGAEDPTPRGPIDDDGGCAAAPAGLAAGLLLTALLVRYRPRVRPRSGT